MRKIEKIKGDTSEDHHGLRLPNLKVAHEWGKN